MPTPTPSLECQQLSPARIAWVLDVSERTVRQWLADGELAHFRVGHVLRSTPEQVLEFILGNTRRARGLPLSPAAAEGIAGEDWRRIERLIVSAVDSRIVNSKAA